jgi:curved DNA-binding protein CbpA
MSKQINIDLYRVLGLPRTCSNNDIENKYIELTKLYHPDNVQLRHHEIVNKTIKACEIKKQKLPPNIIKQLNEKLTVKISEATKTFNLINTAYTKLTKERELYDYEYNKYQEMVDTTERLKDNSTSFLKSQSTVASEDELSKRQQLWEEMNQKHGYNENEASREVSAMDRNAMMKELSRLTLQRTQQESQLRPEKIFDTFDPTKFNVLFEKMHKKSGKELEEFKQPVAFNNSTDVTFCSYDNLGELYTDHNNDINFSMADFAPNSKTVTLKDLDNLDTSAYTSRDLKMSKKEMDKKIAERDVLTNKYNDRLMNDYSKEYMDKITPELEQNDKVFGTLEFGDSDTNQHYVKYMVGRGMGETNIERPQTSRGGMQNKQFKPLVVEKKQIADNITVSDFSLLQPLPGVQSRIPHVPAYTSQFQPIIPPDNLLNSTRDSMPFQTSQSNTDVVVSDRLSTFKDLRSLSRNESSTTQRSLEDILEQRGLQDMHFNKVNRPD